jgi:ABC-2 type transport system permease protein
MDGISQIYWSAFRLLGGVTVPLLLLPDWAFKAVRLMPFRYIVSFPIEVYQGIIDSETIIQGFIISGVWILVELVALTIIFKYGLKNYEAVGI